MPPPTPTARPRRTLLMNGEARRSRAPTRGAPAPTCRSPTLRPRRALDDRPRGARRSRRRAGARRRPARRSKHDAILLDGRHRRRAASSARSPARAACVRFSPVDLPSVPPTSVQLAAGTSRCATTSASPTRASASSRSCRFDDDTPIALGTRAGRRQAHRRRRRCRRKPEIEVIGLKPGDAVVGAAPAPDDAELVFVTSDAQLLRFAASVGAPAGRAGRRHGRHQRLAEGAR